MAQNVMYMSTKMYGVHKFPILKAILYLHVVLIHVCFLKQIQFLTIMFNGCGFIIHIQKILKFVIDTFPLCTCYSVQLKILYQNLNIYLAILQSRVNVWVSLQWFQCRSPAIKALSHKECRLDSAAPLPV